MLANGWQTVLILLVPCVKNSFFHVSGLDVINVFFVLCFEKGFYKIAETGPKLTIFLTVSLVLRLQVIPCLTDLWLLVLPFLSFLFSIFVFGSAGVWILGLTLGRQVIYHLRYFPITTSITSKPHFCSINLYHLFVNDPFFKSLILDCCVLLFLGSLVILLSLKHSCYFNDINHIPPMSFCDKNIENTPVFTERWCGGSMQGRSSFFSLYFSVLGSEPRPGIF
jgi:hypothetical protein